MNQINNDDKVLLQNPVKDFVYLSIPYQSAQILDFTGKVIKTVNGVDSINVTDISSGIYILKVITDEGIILTEKLIIL